LTLAKTFTAIGHESSIAFNRRYHMKDGTVGWNPGKRNPNILKAAGVIDPALTIVFFESADRNLWRLSSITPSTSTMSASH
jgi:hypothetical protein